MEKTKIFLDLMHALSDPKRLKILKMLLERIMSVSEIQTASILKQPSVSKHLLVLKRAGLVHAFKEGLKVYYYAADCDYTPRFFLETLREVKQEKLLDQPDFKLGLENYFKGKGYVSPRLLYHIRRLEIGGLPFNSLKFRLWMDYFNRENEKIRYISRFLRDIHPYLDRKSAKNVDSIKATYRRRSKLKDEALAEARKITMRIRVNWYQGKVASDDLIRAHIIMSQQPNGCQFGDTKGGYKDYPDVVAAEGDIKQSGYSKYRHCVHCWDGQVIEPIP